MLLEYFLLLLAAGLLIYLFIYQDIVYVTSDYFFDRSMHAYAWWNNYIYIDLLIYI